MKSRMSAPLIGRHGAHYCANSPIDIKALPPAHRAIFQAQQAAFEQQQEANDELRATVELLTDTNRRLEHLIGELRRAIYDKKSEKRPLDDRQLAFEDLEGAVAEAEEAAAAPGKERHFSWVTDLPIDESNVMDLMRAGRARWRIENETFNTLKNQGYRFEHNFGHGENRLSTVFAYLMMLAFLIDQIQQRCCRLFRAAQAKAGRPLYFWEKLRAMFLEFALPDWDTLYRSLAFGHRAQVPIPLDSGFSHAAAGRARSGSSGIPP